MLDNRNWHIIAFAMPSNHGRPRLGSQNTVEVFLAIGGEMAYSAFSKQALARLIRAPDPRRFDVDLQFDKHAVLQDASEALIGGRVSLKTFAVHKIRGKSCVSYSDFHSHLVLRAIVNHLAQRFRVAPPSRDAIVRGVIEGVLDGTPLYIIRRDISSFYESVPLPPLRNRLLADVSIPASMRSYLRDFFDAHCAGKKAGIPRGVGLSALLAEMSMLSFDNAVKAVPGVYRYFRFSDDIFILSTLPHSDVIPSIERLLPSGMTFNRRKRQDIPLDEIRKAHAQEVSFEYLGYKFTTKTFSATGHPRALRVSISERKRAKIKTRVILSLFAFVRNRDFDLLRDRLAYATSNYLVRRNGFAVTGGATHVKSGIFYNYRHCGTYAYRQGVWTHEPYDGRELHELDGFLQSLLTGRSSRFAPTIRAAVPASQLGVLKRLSFAQGFAHRMTVRFRPDRISQIKSVWKHA